MKRSYTYGERKDGKLRYKVICKTCGQVKADYTGDKNLVCPCACESQIKDLWKEEVDKEVVEAGYTFVSDGTWYSKGTEAVLLFNISGGGRGDTTSTLQTVEDYIKSGDTNYSGLFGGWCENNPQHADGWDEEGCKYNEFDIYQNGKLMRKATCRNLTNIQHMNGQ